MKSTNDIHEELLKEEVETLEGKYLTFQIGKENYGIEIRYITEIIGIRNITPLPNVPDYIKGVMNLRGQVIPIIDVRLRFKFEDRKYDEHTCIVVVNMENTVVGLVVDRVAEVIDIAGIDIEPPPKVKKNRSSRFMKGLGMIGTTVRILLDVKKLLYDEEPEPIAEAV